MQDMTVLRSPEFSSAPKEPRLMGAFDSKGRGRWYVGAPPDGSRDLPVLVFVPGLGDAAPSFWGRNDLYGSNQLYIRAHADGFRTAFVSFMADNDKPYDIWQDGRILAWQLAEICRYYKVENVTVVAHSKGGIDAQVAAVFYGASPMIRKIITLSSPHWGSQLADLAYSTFGWSLAERIGQHSEGCFCMQTGYMRAFRKAADGAPLNAVPVETLAGNGSAPVLSGVWAGSQVLSLYGENDGVVTVSSAKNPKGRHLATLPFNHVQMMLGQTIWPYLHAAVLSRPLPKFAAHTQTPLSFGLLLRGGGLDKGVKEYFPVDSTVSGIDIGILSSGETAFQVREPGGKEYGRLSSVRLGNFSVTRLEIENPAVGNWQLRAAPGDGAYCAVIKLADTFAESPAEEQPGEGANTQTTLRVLRTFAEKMETVLEQERNSHSYAPPLSFADGFYMLESAVKGVLKDGSAFERTLLRPVMLGQSHRD